MQNKQLSFKNILTYKTDHLKTKPTASITKSTDIDTKQTITDAKPLRNRTLEIRFFVRLKRTFSCADPDFFSRREGGVGI